MTRVMQMLPAVGAVGLSLILFGCSQDGGDDPTWVAPPVSYGDCEHILEGTPKKNAADVPTVEAYATALGTLSADSYAKVGDLRREMRTLLTASDDCWPADNANYAGLMIRLAWHCSGAYRNSDQVGGCGGGRMRFEPERSWPDNTNLDKARALLYPLKKKWGDALSWGDLFILAGQVAYEQAGMAFQRMCFGRIDEADGAESLVLNEACSPGQGKCEEPHGATTVGLIYVNPEGPLSDDGTYQVPDPSLSAPEVRRTFSTMGHSDRSTVALIGGGHAIGKAHGACAGSPGNDPATAFAQSTKIWEGSCGGNGKGANTVTSGFEGYWTSNPTRWDNEYFVNLVTKNWTLHTGPGGKKQWQTEGSSLMMLTADLALMEDPAYKAIVEEFAASQDALNSAFDDAWFDLTTNGAEWSTGAFCTDGSAVPSSRRMRSDPGPLL